MTGRPLSDTSTPPRWRRFFACAGDLRTFEVYGIDGVRIGRAAMARIGLTGELHETKRSYLGCICCGRV